MAGFFGNGAWLGLAYSKIRVGFQLGASANDMVCAMPGACVPCTVPIMTRGELFLLSTGPAEIGGVIGWPA